MPVPGELIFLPIDIFILNIILAIIKFILVSAVGAGFIIYAKYGGEYANSVRWIRSAGYLEMIKTIRNTRTRESVPGSVKWALVAGLLGTFVASVLDKGIAKFVEPTSKLDAPKIESRAIPQFAPATDHQMFLGWNVVVPSKVGVKDAMIKTLNGSMIIDYPAYKSQYEPVTSEYKLACTSYNIGFENQVIRNSTGCANVEFIISNSGALTDSNRFFMTERSPNRWSIVMASSQSKGYSMFDTTLLAQFTLEGRYSADGDMSCTIEENYRRRRAKDIINGVTVFPITATTKCLYDTGDIIPLAMTTMRYTFNSTVYKSEIIDAFFTNSSDKDLFAAMKDATEKQRYLPSSPGTQNITSTEVWAEIRADNSTIEILACGNGEPEYDGTAGGSYEQKSFECVYGVTSLLSITQPINANTTRYLEGNKLRNTKGTYMTLEYVMDVEYKGMTPISLEKMKNDTATVVEYMGLLGFNFYAEHRLGILHISHKVYYVQAGIDVPFWVLVVVGVLTAISLCVWQMTNLMVGSPHNSSAYSIIRTQLEARSSTPVPNLMRFSLQPLMFEDVKLLPDQPKTFPEDIKSL